MRHLGRSAARRLLATLIVGACLAILPALAACSTVTTGEETPRGPVGQIVPSRLALVHTGAIGDGFAAGDDSAGLAAVVAYAHGLEDDGYDVVLLDSGNTLLGANLVDIGDGENAVGFLNAAGYDALALGAQELSLSRRTLATRNSQSDFAMLSANARDLAGEALPFPANITITLSDGRLVGVFGLTAPVDASANTLGAGAADADGELLATVAQQQVADLRKQGCKLVICLTNLAQSPDALTAQELAGKVSGIDVILDAGAVEAGHLAQTDASGDETLVVETPGGLVGASAVLWEQGTLSAQQLDRAALAGTDEQTEALVAQTVREQDAWLEAVIATSKTRLPSRPAARRECCLGDLVADALLWEARHVGSRVSPDVALVDAGSLEAALPKGDITRADALAACPHASTRLCTVQVTGQQLLDALTGALANGAVPGGGLQVAGIEVNVEKARSKDAQVHIKTVGERPFSPTERYLVVATEHAMGDVLMPQLGDAGGDVTSLGTSAGAALINYLERACRGSVPALYGTPQGRIAVTAAKGRR